jgi:hypothetical protein
MAEREGFEPPIPFRVCRFSRPEPSTTRPPLRAENTELNSPMLSQRCTFRCTITISRWSFVTAVHFDLTGRKKGGSKRQRGLRIEGKTLHVAKWYTCDSCGKKSRGFCYTPSPPTELVLTLDQARPRDVAFGKTRVNFERPPAVEFSFLELQGGVFGDQDRKLTPEQEGPSQAGSEGI